MKCFEKQWIWRLRSKAGIILCCLVVALGIRNVVASFLFQADHPGWDFTLRYGEVTCLTEIHTDPYDIFSGKASNDKFRPYTLKYELTENALDYRWCCGYPPWEYTIMLPFSQVSLRAADAIYKGLELFAILVLVFFSFRRSSRINRSAWMQFLLAYSVFLLPLEAWTFVFQYGNWSLLFCAGAVALVVCLDKDWQLLAGLAWAFLMIKPQQGIWFAIPLLFRRQFKTVCVAVATCLVASIPAALLCGKSPLDLIVEIPNFRLQPYTGTSFFPSPVYSFFNVWLFPKAALFLGLAICLVFCIWATWKWRKERDWFVFLQPTFFCVCAGYPLWHQDWVFFFFPILFLLETWARPETVSRSIQTMSLVLAIAMANPLSWILHNTTWGIGTILTESEFLSYATWALFVFLLFLVQIRSGVPEGNSPSLSQSAETVPAGIPDGLENEHPFRPSETLLPFLFLTVFLVGLVYAAFLKNGSFLGIDDADIFFGYAENLCNGQGITYAGNGVHCEGTTSMLWLLLCSLVFKIRLNEPGVLAVSVTLLLASQWMWLRILSRILPECGRSSVAFFVYVIVVLSSAGYVSWMTITLMDSVLWGFLVSWMTLAIVRETKDYPGSVLDRTTFAIPFALAPWSRPEAMLVVLCGLTLTVLFRRSRGLSIRNELVWGIAFLASLGALTLFRLLYFGYPFPNTFYAKVSPSFVYNVQQGTQYLLGYVRSGSFTYLAAVCLVVVVSRMVLRPFLGKRGKGITQTELPWVWCLALFLPPVFAGGDHFGYARFFQPVWPLLCILLVSTFAPIVAGKWPKTSGVDWARIAVLFAFVLFSFFSSGKKWGNNPAWSRFSPIHHEFPIAETGRNNGRILSEMFDGLSEKPVLGVISAGGISRTYHGRIVDLMGLNNTMIAHYPGNRFGVKNLAAFEPALFRELDVDLMPFEPTPFRSMVLKGMLETESFIENWRCGRIKKNENEEETPPFFVENEFLDRLLSTGDYSFRDSYRFENGTWKEIKETVSSD